MVGVRSRSRRVGHPGRAHEGRRVAHGLPVEAGRRRHREPARARSSDRLPSRRAQSQFRRRNRCSSMPAKQTYIGSREGVSPRAPDRSWRRGAGSSTAVCRSPYSSSDWRHESAHQPVEDRVAGGAHPGGCAPPGPQYSMSNALLSGKRCKSVVIHDEKRCPFHTRASAFLRIAVQSVVVALHVVIDQCVIQVVDVGSGAVKAARPSRRHDVRGKGPSYDKRAICRCRIAWDGELVGVDLLLIISSARGVLACTTTAARWWT